MRQEALVNMVVPLLMAAKALKQEGQDSPPLTLRYLGDPILDTACELIEEFDDPGKTYQPLTHLATMMEIARQKYGGVGIAAPQIGLSVRMAIVACEGVKVVLCNPMLENGKGEQTNMEGCLSIPHYELRKKRYETVTVRFQDVLGRASHITASGYLAQTIQHEVDHLNGILFIDGLSRNVRRAAQRAVNRYRRLSGDLL